LVRRIVASLYMSLDGVIDVRGAWQQTYINEEVLAEITARVAEADAVLFGRRTYLDYAAIWPDRGSDDPIAKFLNGSPKYVVTNTLKTLHWEGSRRLRGELGDELARLKAKPGRDLLVAGSPTLVSGLLHDGLLDEIDLYIIPVALGRGRRLFEEKPERTALALADSKAFANGVLATIYRPTG
jgi:dihydrofolate reductase